MAASESDITLIIQSIVASDEKEPSNNLPSSLPIGIRRAQNLISISTSYDIEQAFRSNETSFTGLKNWSPDLCIIWLKSFMSTPDLPWGDMNPCPIATNVIIPENKKAKLQHYRKCLPECIKFAEAQLREGRRVCIACEDGNDLSIGIAVAILQSFFDDDGELDLSRIMKKNTYG